MLTKIEITSYLNRIGIPDTQAPTRAYLFDLHKAHVANISWQTLDIFAGKPTSMDPRESVQLMIQNRSGYCFHLNGSFGTLLRALGFKVSWHRSGVQPIGEEPRVNAFHLGVTVSLTNKDGGTENWIVDVGLGDMPFEPLPLKFGKYEQGPFTYQVRASSVAKHGWRLEHDPLYSYAGVDYAPEVLQNLDVFIPNHEYYCRSIDSPWVNLFLIQQRHALESNELRGCLWKKWDRNEVVTTEISKKSEWFEVLDAVFKEQLVNYSHIEREELWKKVRDQHEKWKKVKFGTNRK